MSGTNARFSADQLTAMQQAIAAANADTDPAKQIVDLEAYYSAQGDTRGYATLAQQVLENTGSGYVANQEIAAAVGVSAYTDAYRAELARRLANADFGIISPAGIVPTLANDATEHLAVFGGLGIDITYWGGTPFTALNTDFTQGVATQAELAQITTADFSALSQSQVQASINHMMSAGISSLGHLGFAAGAEGYFTYQGLQQLYQAKYGIPGNIIIGQNDQGGQTVTEIDDAGNPIQVASFSPEGNLAGGAIFPDAATADIYGTVSGFAVSNKAVVVDSPESDSTTSIAGSGNKITLADGALLPNLSVAGNNNAIIENSSDAYPYYAVSLSGSANSVSLGGFSAILSSAASGKTFALGDTSFESDAAIWSGTGGQDTTASVTVTNADKSSAVYTVLPDAQGSPDPSASYVGANGLTYETVGGLNPSNSTQGVHPGLVEVMAPSGSIVAIEDWREATSYQPKGSLLLEFMPESGPISSFDMTFIADSQSLESIWVYNKDGSDSAYNANKDGSWNQYFFDDAGNRVKSVYYEQEYDSVSQSMQWVTRVVDGSSSSTIYKAGDPAAPTLDLPAEVPHDFAGAAQLWQNLIQTTIGSSAVSSASASVAHDPIPTVALSVSGSHSAVVHHAPTPMMLTAQIA